MGKLLEAVRAIFHAEPLGRCVWCDAATPGASACSTDHQAKWDEYEHYAL